MHNKSILLIEDNLQLQEELEEYLSIYFHSVISADNGEDGYNLYLQHSPDAIFTDINIPKLSGLDLVEKIRQEDVKTPIVILSAYANNEYLLKAIELQLVSYLVKPISTKKLQETIQKVIAQISKRGLIALSNSFIWNADSCELFYKNIQISLTKNEIALVKTLVANRTRFLSLHDLSFEIYSKEEDMQEKNIVQLISRFKKKVLQQIDSDSFFIENIYSSGYRIKSDTKSL